MTRSLNRRIAVLAAVLGTALVAACTAPTAPTADDPGTGSDSTGRSGGIYGGSGTMVSGMVSGGIYGGSGTK